MIRRAAAIVIAIHGVIHLIGFVVPEPADRLAWQSTPTNATTLSVQPDG